MMMAASPARRTRSWESPLSSGSPPNIQVSSQKRTQPFFHCQDAECSDSVGILILRVITRTQRIHVSLIGLLKLCLKAKGRKLHFYRIYKLACLSSFLSCVLAVRNFVLIPQHTSPDLAVKEVDALYDVVADVRKRWSTNVNPFIQKREKNPHVKCNHYRSKWCGQKDNCAKIWVIEPKTVQ